jgi:cytochrome c
MSRLTERKTAFRPASRAANIIRHGAGQCAKLAAALVTTGLLLTPAANAQGKYQGIGRSATPQEIAAWDIDVRPDFKGLPRGAGTVADGIKLWDGKCASCHGSFGESNQMFMPIIGGTTREDIKSGHVASLAGNQQPHRTMIMKLSQLSTLWDYIHRAMPWSEPKSLTPNEVYAVTAYILNMADVVSEDFTLSDRNIAEVQQRLPNRNGMTNRHGLWNVKGKPDVNNTACMTNCADKVGIMSTLPEHARNAHGNLAQQNRLIGPVRGADTTQPAPAAPFSGR